MAERSWLDKFRIALHVARVSETGMGLSPADVLKTLELLSDLEQEAAYYQMEAERYLEKAQKLEARSNWVYVSEVLPLENQVTIVIDRKGDIHRWVYSKFYKERFVQMGYLWMLDPMYVKAE